MRVPNRENRSLSSLAALSSCGSTHSLSDHRATVHRHCCIMSGNPRPRVRDRIRDSLPWRKPSASPSAVGAPGPSTNTRYQQFLESALHKLTPSESDIIRRHLAVNTSDITSAVDQAYNAALGQKQVCESKRWRWSFRGKEIVPREEAEKVLRGLDRLKSVGDVAANVDPLHVGLPWAGIRVILEV